MQQYLQLCSQIPDSKSFRSETDKEPDFQSSFVWLYFCRIRAVEWGGKKLENYVMVYIEQIANKLAST